MFKINFFYFLRCNQPIEGKVCKVKEVDTESELQTGDNKTTYIIAGAACGGAIILFIIFYFAYFRNRKRKVMDSHQHVAMRNMDSNEGTGSLETHENDTFADE